MRTDGSVPKAALAEIAILAQLPANRGLWRRAAERLVEQNLWHEYGYVCDSDKCPASGTVMADAWVIHDFKEYGPKDLTTEQRAAGGRRSAEVRRERYGTSDPRAEVPLHPALEVALHDSSVNSDVNIVKYDPDPDPRDSFNKESHALCDLLIELMAANGCKVPTAPPVAWLKSASLLLGGDNRDPGEAEAVLRWSQANEFWKGNIRSLPKFREKYDTLRLQMQRPAAAGRTGRAIAAARDWQAIADAAEARGV